MRMVRWSRAAGGVAQAVEGGARARRHARGGCRSRRAIWASNEPGGTDSTGTLVTSASST